jgi:hypothetical protein
MIAFERAATDVGAEACVDPRRGHEPPQARCIAIVKWLIVRMHGVPDGFRWCWQFPPKHRLPPGGQYTHAWAINIGRPLPGSRT